MSRPPPICRAFPALLPPEKNAADDRRICRCSLFLRQTCHNRYSMQAATQQLIQHGYLLLFLVSFLERVGIPLLVTPFVLGAGALAGAGRMNLLLVVLITVVPCVIADGGWYWLGKRKGIAVLNLMCRLSLERDSCVRRTQAFTARHSGLLLVYSKFIPGIGRIAPPMAGIADMKL